jgi:hypothetical protein
MCLHTSYHSAVMAAYINPCICQRTSIISRCACAIQAAVRNVLAAIPQAHSPDASCAGVWRSSCSCKRQLQQLPCMLFVAGTSCCQQGVLQVAQHEHAAGVC